MLDRWLRYLQGIGFIPKAKLQMSVSVARTDNTGGYPEMVAVIQDIVYGVTIFFTIDAQGVTPSNLAVFHLLAYCVRCALSTSIAGKQPRSTAPVVA